MVMSSCCSLFFSKFLDVWIVQTEFQSVRRMRSQLRSGAVQGAWG